jgi:dynein heavy chain
LEDQLHKLVVKHEIKYLEDKKELTQKKIHQNKETLQKYKNAFLLEIISCTETLIDNLQLLNKLENIKSKINMSSTELESSMESMSSIYQSRDVYKLVSKKGALFYMSLYELKSIDPLYQFSIDSFMALFLNSINSSKESRTVLNRISNIIDHLTDCVFEFSCISIYEKHNILFLFQMACMLDKDAGKLLDTELAFFIKGNINAEKVSVKNPTTWLSNKCWQHVVNLNTNFKHFSNLIEHIQNNSTIWEEVNFNCFFFFRVINE